MYWWIFSNNSDLLKAKGKSSQRRYGKKMRKLAAEHAPLLTYTPPQHVNSQVLPFLQHSVRQGCIFFTINSTWTQSKEYKSYVETQVMNSCHEIAGQLIVYLLHNHIVVRGA